MNKTHALTFAFLCFFLSSNAQNDLRSEPIFVLKQMETLNGVDSRSIIWNEEINYNPTVNFKESSELTLIPFEFDKYRSFTFVTVYQPSNNKTEELVWGANNSNKEIFLTSKRAAGPGNIVGHSELEKPIPTINIMMQGWDKYNSSVTKNQTLSFGNLLNPFEEIKPFSGKIAEFIVFDRMLRKRERRQLESGLAIKYGVSLNADYYNSLNDVIWSQKSNFSFNNNIAGIGRDDNLLHRLFQVKTSSTTSREKVLTMGFSHSENVNDLTYIVWGENDKNWGELVEANYESISFEMEKKWLVQINREIESPQVNLDFNFSTIDLPENQLPVLIIGQESDQFSEGAKILEGVINYEKGEISFSNVSFDTDKSGSDWFTLAFIEKKSPLQFTIAPNPTENGSFQITVELEAQEDIEIKIFDSTGRLVKTTKKAGNSSYFVKEHLLDKGEYNVELTTPTFKEIRKVIVVN